MFRSNDKSVSGLFYKHKSVTLGDKKSNTFNKAMDDYMEMRFKPKNNKKSNIFLLTSYTELDVLKYVYPLQEGTLGIDVRFKPEVIKNGLHNFKIVLDYYDSSLKIDQNMF